MATNWKVTVRLACSTGLDKDQALTDYWLSFATTPTVSDMTNAGAKFSALYNTIPSGGTNKCGAYISGSMSRTTDACKVDFAEVTSLVPLSLDPVVQTVPFTLPAAYTGSIPLPQQLAVCSSFNADLAGVPEHGAGGTRPAARRRGRFYFGPLNSIALSEGAGTTAAQTVASVVITDLSKATKALRDDLAALGWTWNVFSRVDGAFRPVDSGYVDDAWDVQRRRKVITTGKVAWV